MLSVAEILQNKGRDVFSIAPEATVFDALKMMAERGVGALVVKEGEKLVGVISERDYARKVILKGKSSLDTPVRDIMTAEVYTVSPAHTTEDCMSLMTGKRIRHAPVIDNGALVGMISIGDLVKAVIDDQKFQIKQLEQYISG